MKSNLKFSSRPHARFHRNRASDTLVAFSLAGFLVFSGATMKSNAAARLTNSPSAQGMSVISWNGRGTLEMAAQLSGSWLTISNAASPYTNQIADGAGFFRLNQTVDATTLRKKVMCGYQGWFRCPGDGGSQWIHWSHAAQRLMTLCIIKQRKTNENENPN